MIDEKLKKVLSAITMYRYQGSKNCFDLCISILKHSKNKTLIQIDEDKFEIENSGGIYTFSDGMKFSFDEKGEEMLLADEDSYGVLEFRTIKKDTYMAIEAERDLVYSISTIEILEFGNTVNLKITKCTGTDYLVDPVSNFWIYSFAGKRQTPIYVYCVKSNNCGLWVVRKNWKTEIALSECYPSDLKYTLKTDRGRYTLYGFVGLRLASVVFRNKKNEVKERDVIITASTITDLKDHESYRRIQDGPKVFYI